MADQPRVDQITLANAYDSLTLEHWEGHALAGLLSIGAFVHSEPGIAPDRLEQISHILRRCRRDGTDPQWEDPE